MKTNKYYSKQFAHERWHIYNRNNASIPIYDDARDGNDAPLVFTDYDKMTEYLDKLNNEIENYEY